VLGSKQQLIILATKPAKSHENKNNISCFFVGFVAINTPKKKLSFFIDQTGGFFGCRHFWRIIDKYKKSLCVLCDSSNILN